LSWPRDTLYPQKLVPTSPTSGSRSVGIVRLRTKATEFVFCIPYFKTLLLLSRERIAESKPSKKYCGCIQMHLHTNT
jgi:hypothetical protein